MTEGIPAGDFTLWKPRSDSTWKGSGFFEFHLEARSVSFQRVDEVVDLESL
jgi:hypothetical protein